jgi:putative ABC transport system permease protein
VIVAWMFATLAVVLSVAGLYGLMAHVIGQSTQEIGIRKALGATDRLVTHLFLGRVGLIIVPSLVAGMAIVAVVLRAVRTEIDGLTLDALWWLVPVCCALFGLVCLAAAYVPLRRIRAVDPIRSLRTE